MKTLGTKPNLFMINTPHQLLNAIEAVRLFHPTNNHLMVLLPKNAARERFMALIKAGEWVTVSFPSPFIESKPWVEKLLGAVVHRWYYRCQHLRRMITVARLAARFQNVDKLFLGQYLVEHVPYMRHIANTIQYNALYLLDDGTDTIEINARRNRWDGNAYEAKIDNNKTGLSVWKKLESHLRTKYWDWNLADARSVVFFTIYDIDVRQSDRLIKNDYSYLRSLATSESVYSPDTVIFLGQCVVDGNFEINSHLTFLSEAREYFTGKKVVYVAHPRESAECLAQIMEKLDCELWSPSSIIEYDLIVRGIKPGVVAGVVSSALITLAHLMDSDVEIVCFHIAPEHWIGWREDSMGVYRYLRSKEESRVKIVSLTGEIVTGGHISKRTSEIGIPADVSK